MNLAGAPALTPEEFASYRQKTIIGFDIEVSAPLGHYDETRRINFGANRWEIRFLDLEHVVRTVLMD